MVANQRIKRKATAIIQARMTSKRLPEKCLKDLAGKPMIDHVIERAKAIKGIEAVVLATCDGEENQPLLDRAKALGIESFVGSESNVLERYYQAASEFGGDYIVRITADNPLTDADYASVAVEIAMESGADLTSISNIPLGTAVEVIKYSALEEAFNAATHPHHFEHVTPYIKEHPELFIIEKHPVEIENNISGLRLTVDTDDDYTLMAHIYSALYKGEIIPMKDILAFIKDNPELALLNATVQQRPMTHAETQN